MIVFLKELKKAVAIMTSKITLNAVNEIINFIEDIGEDDNGNIIENENKSDEENSNKEEKKENNMNKKNENEN